MLGNAFSSVELRYIVLRKNGILQYIEIESMTFVGFILQRTQMTKFSGTINTAIQNKLTTAVPRTPRSGPILTKFVRNWIRDLHYLAPINDEYTCIVYALTFEKYPYCIGGQSKVM